MRLRLHGSSSCTKLTYSCHHVGGEADGLVILVRDVVVEVPAPGLHRRHVQLHHPLFGPLGLLPREALAEQTPGTGVVQRALLELLLAELRRTRVQRILHSKEVE